MMPRGYSERVVCWGKSLNVIVCVVPGRGTGVGVAVGLGVRVGVTKGGKVGVGVAVGKGVGVGTRVGVGVGLITVKVGRAEVGVAGGAVGMGIPDGGAKTEISNAIQPSANQVVPRKSTVVVPCGMGIK